MFTGIVTHLGRVILVNGALRRIQVPPPFAHDLSLGASVACDGCCLTIMAYGHDWFEVSVSHQTLSCTTLKREQVGDCINLERALKMSDRLDGHMVTGHVDGVGTLETREDVDESTCHLTFLYPPDLELFLAPKGSVALNGVSLTITTCTPTHLGVTLVAYTRQTTNLGTLNLGQKVNIEVDILARYIARRTSTF